MHGIVGVCCDREDKVTEIPHERHFLRFEFCEGHSHNSGSSFDQLEHLVDKCLNIFMQSNVREQPSPTLTELLDPVRHPSPTPTVPLDAPDRPPSLAPTEPQG